MDITVSRFGVLLRIAFGALLAILAMQPDAAMQPDVSRHSAEAPVALAIQDAIPRAGDLVLARKSTSAARVVERLPAEIGASYDHTTAPSAVIAGAEMPIEVRITNTGLRPLVRRERQCRPLGWHTSRAFG
ncbi:MAG: hypothetical protein E6I48_10875 [Chloroflexi bacterium]|nr:MAG: hypothetical protein E6I48_10875 [Chloroflexota bacterium]